MWQCTGVNRVVNLSSVLVGFLREIVTRAVYRDLVYNKNYIHNFSMETSSNNLTLEGPSMVKKLVKSSCEFPPC